MPKENISFTTHKCVDQYVLVDMILASLSTDTAGLFTSLLGPTDVRLDLADAIRKSLQQVTSVHIHDEARDVPAHYVQVQGSSPANALSGQVGGGHYKGMRIQHAEFCQLNKLTWCESAAIKYLCRHREKNKLQDVDKAIHYCFILRQLEYPDAPAYSHGGK